MNTSSDHHQKSSAAPIIEDEKKCCGGNCKKKVEKKETCLSCRQAIKEAEKKCIDYLAGWQRATADYQNLQKQTVHRLSEIQRIANEELLLELLTMVDHFNYAFRGIPTAERNSNWLKGIEHIQKNFMKILSDHGVEVLQTVGKPFNPEYHEAVEEVSVEGQPSGVVVEEVAAGFLLNGKLIQSAKVKVNK